MCITLNTLLGGKLCDDGEFDQIIRRRAVLKIFCLKYTLSYPVNRNE